MPEIRQEIRSAPVLVGYPGTDLSTIDFSGGTGEIRYRIHAEQNQNVQFPYLVMDATEGLDFTLRDKYLSVWTDKPFDAIADSVVSGIDYWEPADTGSSGGGGGGTLLSCNGLANLADTNWKNPPENGRSIWNIDGGSGVNPTKGLGMLTVIPQGTTLNTLKFGCNITVGITSFEVSVYTVHATDATRQDALLSTLLAPGDNSLDVDLSGISAADSDLFLYVAMRAAVLPFGQTPDLIFSATLT